MQLDLAPSTVNSNLHLYNIDFNLNSKLMIEFNVVIIIVVLIIIIKIIKKICYDYYLLLLRVMTTK